MASGKSCKSKMTSQEQQQIKSNKSGVKCQEKQVKRDISRVKSIDQLRLVYYDWLPDTEYLRLAITC